MNIGLSIITGLKLKEMSQTELASKIGIQKQVVSYWVKGTRIPNLGNIVSVAKAFGVPVSKFIEWGEKE